MAEQIPIPQSPEQVATWIAEVLRGDVNPTSDGCTIAVPGHERRLALANARVHEINESLSHKRHDGGTILWDARTYESLIREESRFGPPLLLREQGHIRKEDADGGLVYSVGTPSDDYILFLLSSVGGAGNLRALRVPLGLHRIARMLDDTQDDGPLEAIGFFKQLFPRLQTVVVESARSKPTSDLALQSSAFLFQLTYNLDVSLVETRSWDDLLRVSRIAHGRRSKVQDIEPPRRVYLPDLLYHYQMGVAADSPVLGFLSYYHIAEHFFDEVFNDDLITSVRDRLTQPGFSYRRKKDIETMIREITRRLRIRGESTVFSEQEALRLTLLRYVKRDELVARVRSYDDALISHYAQSQVSFCAGDLVDLENGDDAKFFDLLARRVYKTRNAVVHSKDGDKNRFVPFEHDRILAREVPLVRFCAEAIIVGSSSLVQ